MALDNPRVRARSELEELGLSRESASYLVDDRPSGGWDSLVTHDQLRAELAGVRVEIANLASELRKEMRDQSWRLTTALLATVTLMTVILRLT
jgi:hypothetical protein